MKLLLTAIVVFLGLAVSQGVDAATEFSVTSALATSTNLYEVRYTIPADLVGDSYSYEAPSLANSFADPASYCVHSGGRVGAT